MPVSRTVSHNKNHGFLSFAGLDSMLKRNFKEQIFTRLFTDPVSCLDLPSVSNKDLKYINVYFCFILGSRQSDCCHSKHI